MTVTKAGDTQAQFMSRRPRNQILFDGAFAHIISRSINGTRIFEEAADFLRFKELLLQAKKVFRFQIHHYCLMNTHFHMAVSIASLGLLARGLQQVKWQYTKWFNAKYLHEGPIWRERFKSLLIENESYLHACGLYIEANPVKAGCVEQPYDWPFSSSAHYGLEIEDPLVDDYDRRELPDGADQLDEEFFVKGKAIGSDLFRLQVRENLFQSMTVP